MTIFGDNLEVGNQAAVSAAASHAPVRLTRHVDITGATATKQFLLPKYSENFDAMCYIISDGSAATTDSIVVSAGGTTLLTFSSMGSAQGLVKSTQAGLGTLTVLCSACDSVTTTSEVTANVTLASTDADASYRVVCTFNVARTQMGS